MDFSMFLHGYRRYLLRACGLIQTVTILTVQKKTWLQRSMVVQLPFLVAHDGWTTLSGFFTRWECFCSPVARILSFETIRKATTSLNPCPCSYRMILCSFAVCQIVFIETS